MSKSLAAWVAACLFIGAAASRASEPGVSEPLAADLAAPEEKLDRRSPASGAGYREHAPLALFSLGSLVVGGAFYGIHASYEESRGAMSGNGSRMGVAVGAAGLTALASGLAYLYFAHASEKNASAWEGRVSGGPVPGGLAAAVTIPLSSFSR